jgi:hypothetical protein
MPHVFCYSARSWPILPHQLGRGRRVGRGQKRGEPKIKGRGASADDDRPIRAKGAAPLRNRHRSVASMARERVVDGWRRIGALT